jgi:pyruvate/2-oxoglutarate dehydrogenase complex dihydrolipoamide acyltransferase (E2) component
MEQPRISPLAKKLAKDRGVKPEDLVPSGPGNRIMARDVPEEPAKEEIPAEVDPFPDIDTKKITAEEWQASYWHAKAKEEDRRNPLTRTRSKIASILSELTDDDLVEITTESTCKNGRSTERVTIRITKDIPAGHDGIEF